MPAADWEAQGTKRRPARNRCGGGRWLELYHRSKTIVSHHIIALPDVIAVIGTQPMRAKYIVALRF